MSFWNILEIDPTEDIRVIKKAYAKKLKIHHPEDDPEGYQKLREAYDFALAYVKEEKVSTVQAGYENSIGSSFDFESNTSFSDEISNEKSTLDVFIERLTELYADFPSRIDITKWENALNDEVVWNAGYQDILRAKMLDFLTNHPFLPKNIWLLLESIFNWRAQEDYFFEHFPESFVHFLFRQLNDPLEMSFRFLQEAEGIDYDTFLFNRENAFYALADNNLEHAASFITEAMTIFSGDPDLLRMQGEYYFRMEEWQQALQSYDHALELAPDDMDCLLNRARTLREMGELASAIEACSHIGTIDPENVDAMYLQGKCYFELGDTDKAKDTFQAALAKNPVDIEGKIYLARINGQLLDELKGVTSKENRQKRHQIKNELEIPRLLQTVRSFSLLALRKTWLFLLIVGIVLAFSLSGSPSEERADQSVTQTEEDPELITINFHSSKELNQAPPGAKTRVKLSLSNVLYLGSLDDDEMKVEQIPDLENRYFVFTEMNDQYLLINVNYEQAQQAYNHNTLNFEGQIYEMDSDTLNFFGSYLKQNFNSPDSRFGDYAYSILLKDKYLGPIETSKETSIPYSDIRKLIKIVFTLPISIYIFWQLRKKRRSKMLQSNY